VRVRISRSAGRLGLTAALIVPAFAASGMSASATGLTLSFAAPPIATAGSIGPGASTSFTLSAKIGTAAAPNTTVWITQTNGVGGDATLIPSAQCNGKTQIPTQGGFNQFIQCTTDGSGNLVMTYQTPTQTQAFGEADWQAQDASSHPSTAAITHYVYCAAFRFSPSPIAAPGSLTTPGTSVPLTLTVDNAVDQGVANSNVLLSFKATSGGGTAFVGTTQLTSTPAMFTSSGTGSIQLTYTAPGTLPSRGQDSIVVQDPARSAAAVSDAYSFTSGVPVISIGNVSVNEADQQPGIPANFTVTITPVQTMPVTVQYTALCGIGDKECGEDFRQITSPKTLTIPAGAKSTVLRVGQYSYDGRAEGETYNEGFFVVLNNPAVNGVSGVAVLGRAIGEGTLLPDIENGGVPVPDLYVGGAGLVPIADGLTRPIDFVVTLGALQTSPVTFTYATADGTGTAIAVAGTDYVAKTGTATIPAGKSSVTIAILLEPNAAPLTPKTFTFTISNASGGLTVGRATGTGTVMAS
jgi:hypothetical protein